MQNEELNIVGFIKFLSSKRDILIIFAVIGVVLAVGLSYEFPQYYRAETVIRIGDMPGEKDNSVFLQDSERVADSINYGLESQYPDTSAKAVSGAILELSSGKQDKDQAIREVSEVTAWVVEQDSGSLRQVQSLIDTLEDYKKGLQFRGIQTENVDLRIFDLQNRLDGVTRSQRQGEVSVSKKGLPLFVNVFLGMILGVFVGMFWVSLQSWWHRNKEHLLS